jgi:hypothetical protein
MNNAYITRNLKALAVPVFLAVFAASAPISQAEAGGNMEKVDIVKEGIDLDPIYVGSNASGYTGSENKAHKYMVRVFAKAKGQNRVWNVEIYGVAANAMLFNKNVGKSEGWSVYGKSHVLHAKPGSMGWVTTPGTACKNLLKQKVAAGMNKADVLKSDRKTTALALIGFSAYADSKSHNKNNKHVTSQGVDEHQDSVAYQVPVICRAVL